MTAGSQLRHCKFDQTFDYKCAWSCRQVPLNADDAAKDKPVVASEVSYHPTANKYCLASYVDVPFTASKRMVIAPKVDRKPNNN